VELLGDERARRELAERGYQAFSARSQADIVDRALSDLEDVTHETAARDDPYIDVRPNGEDHSADHQLRNRSLLRHKSEQERDQLLAEVERKPEDARSVLFLAQTCFQLGDFVDACRWYARRAEMGGCDEEVYYAMYRLAQSMQQLGEPWPDVEDAYLRAWIFRPTRAEALYAIAFRCRVQQRYQVGYLFAQRAAETPVPDEDLLLPAEIAQVYAWRAADEQAICAARIGKHAEAFTLCRRLLASPDIPEGDRQRIATNRDFSVPAMTEAATPYPEALVGSLVAGPRDAEVTVSLVAGPDRQTTEQTINSFLTCCLDVSRVGRFLVVDTGLSASDRAKLRKRYGFLEFARRRSGDGPAAQLARLHAQIGGRFWLHLGEGWRFFAPENLITRLTAVLDAEPQVFQVGINFADAVNLTGASAAEEAVRRAPEAGRYLITEAVASGPAMFDTARLDRAGDVHNSDPDPPAQRGRPPTRAGLRTASLDEVLCISGLKPYERRVEIGGIDEEAYYAMYRQAESMSNRGEPWPDVEDAYLKAWQIRPTRAEPLHAIAFRYRVEQRYKFAYLFAESAAKIPLPEEDRIFISADIYAWRATDEQAVCASRIGKHAEAFTLCRRLVARPDLPEGDRRRIAANRDFSVPAMIEAASSSYPEALVQSLAAGPGQAEVTVSLVAGPDRQTTEQTINSFLTCCLDVSRVGRFLVLDTGLSAPDRAILQQRYGFLKFARRGSGDGPGARLARLRAQIDGRFWLHLGEGWRFFAPENYITRLTAVLDAEPQVFQVGINFADAVKLTGASAAEQAIRRTPDAGRYMLTETMARGPAMFDTARLDRAIGVQNSDPDPPAQRGRPATRAGLRTASLDEVLCISGRYL
jgi:tetratricopeptide (TPR) repeat protein